MAKFSPPHAVRAMIEAGMALPEQRETTAALARYLHRLVAARSPEANDEFVRVFHAIADRSLVRHKPAQKIMCGKGCALCCRSHVSVLAPEAFALARSIRSPARHADLHGRIRALAVTVGEMDVTARRRAGIGCSFLVADACSAYAARPLTCRMLASFDLGACVASGNGGADQIPQPNDYHTIRSLLAMAAYAALAAAGLPVVAYELNGALTRLIDDPGLEARWYDGGGLAAPEPLSDDFHAAVARVRADARI